MSTNKYADAGPAGDKAPKGLPHAWMNTTQGGRFFAWGAMHTMKPIELPFTYDFRLNALSDVAGYDTVATELAAVDRPFKGREWSVSGRDLEFHADIAVEVRIRNVAWSLLFAGGKGTGRTRFRLPEGSGTLFLTFGEGGGRRTEQLVHAQGMLLGR